MRDQAALDEAVRARRRALRRPGRRPGHRRLHRWRHGGLEHAGRAVVRPCWPSTWRAPGAWPRRPCRPSCDGPSPARDGSWRWPRRAERWASTCWPPTARPSTASSASSAAWPPSWGRTGSRPTRWRPARRPPPCSTPAPPSTACAEPGGVRRPAPAAPAAGPRRAGCSHRLAVRPGKQRHHRRRPSGRRRHDGPLSGRPDRLPLPAGPAAWSADPSSAPAAGPGVLVGGAPVRVLRLRAGRRRRVDRWAPASLSAPARAAGPGPSPARRRHRPPPPGTRRRSPAVGGHGGDPGAGSAPTGWRRTLTALGAAAAVIVVDDGSLAPVASDRQRASSATGLRVARRRPVTPGGGPPPPTWSPSSTRTASRRPVGSTACSPISPTEPSARPGPADRQLGAGLQLAVPPTSGSRSPLDLGPREALVAARAAPCRTCRRRPCSCAGRPWTRCTGFDEALRFGEDVDLVWRLIRLGWRVRYQPAATVAHPARDDLRGLAAAALRYGRSAAPLWLPGTARRWRRWRYRPGQPAWALALRAAIRGRRPPWWRPRRRPLARRAGARPGHGQARGRAGAAAATCGRDGRSPAPSGGPGCPRLMLPVQGPLGPGSALAAALAIPPLAEWVRSDRR